jgi:hypothetical protein
MIHCCPPKPFSLFRTVLTNAQRKLAQQGRGLFV